MINLGHIVKNTAATIRVPIVPDIDFGVDSYAFVLRSLIDKRTVSIDQEDSMSLSLTHSYATFRVLYNEDAPDGEYAYELIFYNEELSIAKRVSSGLATVGDYKHTAKTFNQTIQFKQYDI